MQTFVYEALPARVVFGTGTLSRLGDEVERLGLRRVLVLATPPQRNQAERLAEMLGARSAGAQPLDSAKRLPCERTFRKSWFRRPMLVQK